MKYQKTFIIIILSLVSYVVFGQPINTLLKDVVMPSPEAASLGKFGEIPVDYSRGVPDISIPIHTVTDGSLQLPITLRYHASGLRVREISSWVGAGWDLNAGGMVSRVVQGRADDIAGFYRLSDPLDFDGPNEKRAIMNGEVDGEPDIFSYSFPGYSGKFYFDENHDYQFVPKADLQLELIDNGNFFDGFIITAPNGAKYKFGQRTPTDKGYVEFTNADAEGSDSYRSGWYLVQIESFNGTDVIDLYYDDHDYIYEQASSCRIFYVPAVDCHSSSEENSCNVTPNIINIDIEGKKLDSIVSSTDVITFTSNSSRLDLDGGNKLDEIKIGTGPFCKAFNFTYDYFEDPGVSGMEGKRLKLDQLQEGTCSGAANPAYQFSYHDTIINGNPFFINRLSEQIDHWGYFNGESGNDNNTGPHINIPPTTVAPYTKGDANRDSDYGQMVTGTLKSITYPTGGSTEFEFEANCYAGVVAGQQEQLLQILSCVDFNSGCCGAKTDDDTHTFTSAGEITNGSFVLYLNPSEDCFNPDENYFLVHIKVYDDQSGAFLGEYECSTEDTTQVISVDEPLSTLYAGLVPNVSYRFELTTEDAFGRFRLFTQPVLPGNIEAGGLRVKKTTHKDGSGADDIVKSYTYPKSEGSPLSSGILLKEPNYGYLVQAVNFHGNTEQSIQVPLFSEQSLVPLSNFEGYHIAYERVEETLPNNGKTVFIYDVNFSGVDRTYPAIPFYMQTNAGKMTRGSVYSESGTALSVGSTSPTSNTFYHSSLFLKTSLFKVLPACPHPSVGNYTIGSYALYDIRTGIYQVELKETVVDGVSTSTNYEYDTLKQHFFPTKISTVNSDGKTHSTHHGYVFDFSGTLYDEMADRNMIAAPIRTETKVDGVLVDGSHTIYDFFNGSGFSGGSGSDPIYPKEFRRYETTWDTSGNIVPGTWATKGTVLEYDMDIGRPERFQQTGWQEEYYTWNSSNKRIASRSFIGYTWSYDYYAGTPLLSKITGIDGQETEFEYDAFMRLNKTKDRKSGPTYNRWTDYEYNIGGTVDSNYVKMTENFTPVAGSGLTGRTVWQYFDGLGRLDQTVEQKKTPGEEDIINKIIYDGQGRPTHRYVPYTSLHSTGQHHDFFWSLPIYKYALTEYEDSPLGRAISGTPPDWYATTISYGSNTSNEVIKDHNTNTHYAADELVKATTTSPDSNRTTTFTDKLGRPVLTRNGDSSGNNDTGTYNLYDDKNRLAKVLPPGAGPNTPNLWFKYLYDERDNILKKKVPDAGPMTFWYNERDLPKFIQDGNLLDKDQRICTYHDGYGRPAQTGFVPHTGPPSGEDPQPLPSDLLTETTYGTSGTSEGKVTYSKAKVLGTSVFLDTYYNYDSYGRLSYTNGDNHLNDSTFAERTDFTYDFAGNILTQYRQHQDSSSFVNTIDETFTYDHWGRPINHNHRINGGTDVRTANNVFDWRSRLKQKNLHQTVASYLQNVDYTYNEQDWLTGINDPFQMGSGLFALDIRYDNPETGFSSAVQAKKGGNISQLIWNSASLDEEQTYGYGYDFLDRLTVAEYGISGTVSSSAPEADLNHRYSTTYSYDQRGNILTIDRNGLLPGDTYGPIDDLTLHYLSGTNRFDYVEDGVDIPCTLTYDLADTQNTSATYRAEQSITSTQTITNNVTVSYHAGDSITLDSNFQVDTNSIFSAIIEPCRHPLAGFVDSDSTYHYDGNGNITYDPDRNITIYYNHLNLPDSVMLDGGQWIRFTYAADGTKLKKANSTGDVKHYINGVEYLGGDMEAIYHAEGRAVPDSMGGFRYEYTLKDHLGNSRAMFSDLNGDETVDETEILQENHYYPFGMNMQGAWGAGTNQYQYNGKELDSDLGIDWYHYGARMFDPAIGRFTGVDPLADFAPGWTPYRYAFNNPLTFIDPDGLFESRKEAKEYANENDIKTGLFSGHSVKKQEDGSFAIRSTTRIENDEGAQVAYAETLTFDLGKTEDGEELGVGTSVTIKPTDKVDKEDSFFTIGYTNRDGSTEEFDRPSIGLPGGSGVKGGVTLMGSAYKGITGKTISISLGKGKRIVMKLFKSEKNKTDFSKTFTGKGKEFNPYKIPPRKKKLWEVILEFGADILE